MSYEETSRPVIFESDGPGAMYWRKGSSVLLSTSRHYYWATAAHVLRNLGGSPETLRIFPSDTSRISLPFNEQYGIRPDYSDDDDYQDIAMLRIDLDDFDASGDSPLVTLNLDRAVFPAERLTTGNELWIIGYPNESNFIDYDTETIKSTRSVLRAIYTGPAASAHCHSVSVKTTVALNSYDGLSGSPVFYQSSERGAMLVGMLIRGTASSRTAHFIDAKVLWNIVRVAEEQSVA